VQEEELVDWFLIIRKKVNINRKQVKQISYGESIKKYFFTKDFILLAFMQRLCPYYLEAYML
jgi:hypothetical protein